MITLRQIRNAHPSRDGWEKVISANGGTKADFDAEFELASIIDSNGLDDCLWALQCKPEYQHVYRKFAVICADEVSHLMDDERSLSAIEVAWSHSFGEASDDDLDAAARGAARADAGAAARGAARDYQAKVMRHALTTGLLHASAHGADSCSEDAISHRRSGAPITG